LNELYEANKSLFHSSCVTRLDLLTAFDDFYLIVLVKLFWCLDPPGYSVLCVMVAFMVGAKFA